MICVTDRRVIHLSVVLLTLGNPPCSPYQRVAQPGIFCPLIRVVEDCRQVGDLTEGGTHQALSVNIVAQRGDALVIVGERAGQPVGGLVGLVATPRLPDHLEVALRSLSPRRVGVLPERRALLDAEGLEVRSLAPENCNVGQDVDDRVVAFRAVLLRLCGEAQVVLHRTLGEPCQLSAIPTRDSTVPRCPPRF